MCYEVGSLTHANERKRANRVRNISFLASNMKLHFGFVVAVGPKSVAVAIVTSHTTTATTAAAAAAVLLCCRR